MAFQYGQYDPTYPEYSATGSSPSDSVTAGTFHMIAVGAFTGSDGLPADGTPITSEADFNAYVSALLAKTTQIETDPTSVAYSGNFGRLVDLGGNGNDIINGTSATSGSSFFMGRGGNDTITGTAGHDKLEGDGGNDRLVSSGDGDTLNGGTGADTYVFTALSTHRAATFTNFVGDTLDLSAVDADTTQAGDQAFSLVTHFDGHAGEMQIKYDHHTGRNLIRLDTNGDGIADHVITIVTGNDFSHIVY